MKELFQLFHLGLWKSSYSGGLIWAIFCVKYCCIAHKVASCTDTVIEFTVCQQQLDYKFWSWETSGAFRASPRAKPTTIWRTAVRETDVIWKQGGLIEGPVDPLEHHEIKITSFFKKEPQLGPYIMPRGVSLSDSRWKLFLSGLRTGKFGFSLFF